MISSEKLYSLTCDNCQLVYSSGLRTYYPTEHLLKMLAAEDGWEIGEYYYDDSLCPDCKENGA